MERGPKQEENEKNKENEENKEKEESSLLIRLLLNRHRTSTSQQIDTRFFPDFRLTPDFYLTTEGDRTFALLPTNQIGYRISAITAKLCSAEHRISRRCISSALQVFPSSISPVTLALLPPFFSQIPSPNSLLLLPAYSLWFPSIHQGHNDVNIWSPFLSSIAVPISPYLVDAIGQDENAGFVLIYIKIVGRLRWKVGSWISDHYHIDVSCPAFFTVANSKDNGGLTGFRFQRMTSCTVDV
ncbi:hypothetical protein KFK09_002604 [Dendrobium nobile]|uniref:Uncharacterized protein n=1 Tax=Dendrobium nobile TaxID=94219 RepID=A0A8T3C448_DENNO|nr:hypothetical protein KFK09_002604 [Dendrobium nobile]